MTNYATHIKPVRKKRKVAKKRSVVSIYNNSVKLNDFFIDGFTSIFAVYPSKRIIKLRTIEDDTRAIASDWRKVGGVIRHAMTNFKTIDK